MNDRNLQRPILLLLLAAISAGCIENAFWVKPADSGEEVVGSPTAEPTQPADEPSEPDDEPDQEPAGACLADS